MKEIPISSSQTSEIENLEQEIQDAKKRLVTLRKELAPREAGAYTFKTWRGSDVTLDKLFGKSDELMVIHNMGKKCPYCTLWADGFNGIWKHLDNRAPFVVVSNDKFNVQRDFAKGRGWKFKMVSSHGTSFFKDMGFAGPKGEPWPGVSTFLRTSDRKIWQITSAGFGPWDDYCALWPLIELLPKGTNDWEPKYKYR
jgi:predicted dithiol-disulfide oxidoreductase (DUF899 family)